MNRILILLFLFTAACAQKAIRPAGGEMTRLLQEADTDHDQKITILDKPTKFVLQCRCGKNIEVSGAYHLSNLLQEMKLSEEEQRRPIEIARIFENPVDRISRSIRERYWGNLVRRVEETQLSRVLVDPKLPNQKERYLFVPVKDAAALERFKSAAKDPALKMTVIPLPEKVDAAFMRSIKDKHGLLYLPRPYVVPGGRFNEMYGWDSYFEALGLIQDGRVDLARAMTDNFIYQIEHYGKILNANRSYYLNRSQPPFLTSMVLAVSRAQPKNSANAEWQKRATEAAIKEYFEVWMSPPRLTELGLSRYHGEVSGVPPEVEPGHLDFLIKPAAARHKIPLEKFTRLYNEGKIKDPRLTIDLTHDLAVRESGHDTTYRFKLKDDVNRITDSVTVDLNSLLYKYEVDLAQLTGDRTWLERAQKRKDLMMKYMWDEEHGLFFDYNWLQKFRSQFVNATAFYPMWAGMVDPAQGQRSLKELIKRLEVPGGILSNDEASLKYVFAYDTPRQWDYPNGWAPHQMLAWQGLKNYGLTEDMNRLVYRWLYMITRNAADFNGTIPEKFDVVKRSHAVFAEYGNVGTDFAYITQEGFGWMNASYQVGLAQLPANLKASLRELTAPEKLFK